MKVDEQLKCRDCDWYGSCEYYHNRKETSQICKMFNNTWKFVAELEKIKAELKKYANNEVIAISIAEESGLKIAIGVLDKHIKELKGENNE